MGFPAFYDNDCYGPREYCHVINMQNANSVLRFIRSQRSAIASAIENRRNLYYHLINLAHTSSLIRRRFSCKYQVLNK